jgi:hypothetical protein
VKITALAETPLILGLPAPHGSGILHGRLDVLVRADVHLAVLLVIGLAVRAIEDRRSPIGGPAHA